jgi:hypothetical protein
MNAKKDVKSYLELFEKFAIILEGFHEIIRSNKRKEEELLFPYQEV